MTINGAANDDTADCSAVLKLTTPAPMIGYANHRCGVAEGNRKEFVVQDRLDSPTAHDCHRQSSASSAGSRAYYRQRLTQAQQRQQELEKRIALAQESQVAHVNAHLLDCGAGGYPLEECGARSRPGAAGPWLSRRHINHPSAILLCPLPAFPNGRTSSSWLDCPSRCATGDAPREARSGLAEAVSDLAAQSKCGDRHTTRTVCYNSRHAQPTHFPPSGSRLLDAAARSRAARGETIARAHRGTPPVVPPQLVPSPSVASQSRALAKRRS